jgi:ADP-dependent NAD(P)H-hydrate dehydratase
MTTPMVDLLRAQSLPSVNGDKHDRGVALVVAGRPECPGAAVLTGTAALRAGVGKVQIVTHPDIVSEIGIAVPEALVVGWNTEAEVTERVSGLVAGADAVLVGPGLDATASGAARRLGQHLSARIPLLLDAQAVAAAADLRGQVLLVLPNHEEASDLASTLALDAGGEEHLARDLASALGATVAVRGSESVLSDGRLEWMSTGHPGLGTAGSGDVLAGVAAGFAARGASPLSALGWAMATHATAGMLLGDHESSPGYGYLARELVAAIPKAIASLLSTCETTKGEVSGPPTSKHRYRGEGQSSTRFP